MNLVQSVSTLTLRIWVRILAEEIVVKARYEWAVMGWPAGRLVGIYWDETIVTVNSVE